MTPTMRLILLAAALLLILGPSFYELAYGPVSPMVP